MTLPNTTPLGMLSEIRNQLDKERAVVQRSSQPSHTPSQQAGTRPAVTPQPRAPAQQNNLHQILVCMRASAPDKKGSAL